LKNGTIKNGQEGGKIMSIDNELKEQKFDAMLKPALYEQMIKEMEGQEMPVEGHQFSRTFERRMKRLVRKNGAAERYRSVKAAVALGMAVVVALGVVTMNVEALRVPIWNLFMGEEYSVIDFGGKKEEIEIPVEYEGFVPEYVVPGYELVYAYGDDESCYLQYSNIDGQRYNIAIYMGNKRTAFDTEDGEVIEKEIEDYNVIFMEKDEEMWASFMRGTIRYVIEGNLKMQDIEELVREMN